MKHLKTLRVRFALWTAALLLAVLTLFSFFIYIRTAQSLADTVDSELRLAASQAAAELDIHDKEVVPIDDFFKDMPNLSLREHGFSFRIVDSAGQMFQEYGPYQALLQPQVDFTASDQPGVFATFTDPATRHQVRVYTEPILQDNQQIVGQIQVARNLNSNRQTLNQLLVTLWIGGPLLVVVAGAGGYFLAARALAPIDKITRTARQISARDLSARLNLPHSEDEAGRLAATFDSMLSRLEDSFQRERRFTADASHELRTPLAAMQTILGSTLARRRTLTEYEQVLADLGEETERLHTLIEGLLQLARSENTSPMVTDTINLSHLLTDVTDSLRLLANDKGLELTADIAENLTVTGDSDALIRLFVNLLDNAIKFTTQGYIKVIALRRPQGQIEITISDTGAGIAAADLPYIFGRFYRADKSRSTPGIGLGLAIAARVAQAHSGAIRVESEIGKGTVFTVQLATT
ncbi:MAG: Adaptive-response sensory-kinase SasA [Anaerolineae bacterium]|nr:Adaptive-response sensory-kinase SasA [Anaerolineae bacterium]